MNVSASDGAEFEELGAEMLTNCYYQHAQHFSECQKGKKQKAKSWSDPKSRQKLEECHESVRKAKNGGIPRNAVRTFVQGIRVKIRPSTRQIGPSLALFVSPLRPCNPCDTGNSSYGGHKSESRQILFSFVLSLMTGVVRYMFFLSFFV